MHAASDLAIPLAVKRTILPSMITAGSFEISSIVNGTIRLDGGAMFGVVPKVMWQESSDVDEMNRILLATRTLLAVDRTNKRVVLVDTGCGAKWLPDEAQRYAINHNPDAIPGALRAAGLSVDDVTDIVITHLHFDHNGGLTDWFDDPGGRTTVRYPKAKHWVHRSHWAHAMSPGLKDQGSFLERDYATLAEAGVLGFVDGDTPDAPFAGLEWFVSHGHTPGQLHPIFGSGASRVLFAGDIIPTVAHLRLGWVMAFDVQPVVTIEEKEGILVRCLEEGVALAFPHDTSVGGAFLDGTVRRPIVRGTVDL